MNSERLKSLQLPLKEKYQLDPSSASITLKAVGHATEALVACAGVTLRAVATAIGVELRDAKVVAEGDLDFRGTLGVSKEAPVGFKNIRLRFELDTRASEEQRATLIRLTERYCVVLQTLRTPAAIAVESKQR